MLTALFIKQLQYLLLTFQQMTGKELAEVLQQLSLTEVKDFNNFLRTFQVQPNCCEGKHEKE